MNKLTIIITSFIVFLISISGYISGFITTDKNYMPNNKDNKYTGLKCTIYDREPMTKNDDFLKNDFSTDEYKKINQGF